MFAEFLAIHFDQAAAVPYFLEPHAIEDGGCGWKIGAQALGEIGIDAFVFLFERNGQSRFRSRRKTFARWQSAPLARLPRQWVGRCRTQSAC